MLILDSPGRLAARSTVGPAAAASMSLPGATVLLEVRRPRLGHPDRVGYSVRRTPSRFCGFHGV